MFTFFVFSIKLTVSSTSAGLLANLAVHDPIANMLVRAGGISAIARMLRTKSHKQDILLERNACNEFCFLN